MGNVSKKGKNMKGIITWSTFAKWFFRRTLSIYEWFQIGQFKKFWQKIYKIFSQKEEKM